MELNTQSKDIYIYIYSQFVYSLFTMKMMVGEVLLWKRDGAKLVTNVNDASPWPIDTILY